MKQQRGWKMTVEFNINEVINFMTSDEYAKALRAGQKEYDACVSKGVYPYLMDLDDILANTEIECRTKLGLVEIPMDQIAGTYTKARSNAFARNFMPLFKRGTEFSCKWEALYDSMEEEGLRDPIVAYEFLNKFYVQEGNKRVSVSRYMGAVSIEGQVIRLIPKKTDAKEIEKYYEFLDFYDKTQINYLNFTKSGSYSLLLCATCEDPEAEWTDDQKLDLKSVYTNFRREFLAKGGSKLTLTAADALLIYLNIFGYEKAKQNLSADWKVDLTRIWKEFLVYSRENSITISLNPIEDPKRHTLAKLMSGRAYAAAWVYVKKPEQSAWTYSHELGREYVEDVLGTLLQTDAYFDVLPENAETAIEEIIRDGYNIIFLTSPQYIAAATKAAVEHPDIKILNCCLNMSYHHVRSYYLRMYEAKFLIGAIAGSLTPNNKIGYVADYPIFGSAASINAFALGASMVNPDAEVYLKWTTLKTDKYDNLFAENDVTLISSRDLNATASRNRDFGLFFNEEQPRNIAMPVWHWGKLYEEILRSIINGNWKDEENTVGLHSLNYWWGMSADAIEVIHSEKLSEDTKRLIRLLTKAIKSGEFHPFSDLIYFQDGTCIDAGAQMEPMEIIRMNKLVKNVRGFIPTIDDVREEFQMLIRMQGLFRPEAETQL